MGQGTSSGGQVSYPSHSFVHLEDNTIIAGGIITGNVNIQVEQPINISDISIVIKGKEYTYWKELVAHRRYIGGKSRVHYTLETRTGLNVIFTHSVPLLSLNGTLMAGQYTIPFSTKVPDNLKHSIRLIVEGFIGRRYYTIKAKVAENRKLKALKNFLWVSNTVKNAQQLQPVNRDQALMLKNCCCFGSGKAVAHLTIDKEAYYITDKINGVFKNDNTSSKKVLEKFTIQLVRTLRLKDNVGHSYLINDCLLSEERIIEVPSNTGPITSYNFILDLEKAKGLWMLPSNDSGLFECVYNVKIRPRYDTCCSGIDYQIAAYIDVCNSTDTTHAAKIDQNIPKIESWNPVFLSPQPQMYLQPMQYNQVQYAMNQQYDQTGQYIQTGQYAIPSQYPMVQQYTQPEQYAMTQQYTQPGQYAMPQAGTQPEQYGKTQQVMQPEQYGMTQQAMQPGQYSMAQQYTQPGQYAMPQSGIQPEQYGTTQQYTQPGQYNMPQSGTKPEEYAMTQQVMQSEQNAIGQSGTQPEQYTMAQPLPQAIYTERPEGNPGP